MERTSERGGLPATPPAAPPVEEEPRIWEAEYEILDGTKVARSELDAACRRQAELEQALADETLAAEAQGAAHRRELSLLERRVAKLKTALAERENDLRSAGSQQLDGGLSSVYREVQGLDMGSENAKQKKEMLTVIFEANRKLHEDLTAMKSAAE